MNIGRFVDFRHGAMLAGLFLSALGWAQAAEEPGNILRQPQPESVQATQRVLDKKGVATDRQTREQVTVKSQRRASDTERIKSVERNVVQITALPEKSVRPRLTALRVPAVFEATELLAHTMYFAIEGQDLSPLLTDAVTLSLLDGDGNPVEAVFTNAVTVQDLIFGRETVGLSVVESELAAGDYQLCADIRPFNNAAAICASFELLYLGLTPCQEDFLQAIKDHPDFGCRCKNAKVHINPKSSPDGSLGKFSPIVGGNTFGSFKKGYVHPLFGRPPKGGFKPMTVTSVMKFEAHFEAEAVNAPAKPKRCAEKEWQALIAGFLCAEGQDINNTIVLRAGTAQEKKYPMIGPDPDKEGQKKPFPYTTKSKDPKQFTPDGHGYRIGGDSAGTSIKGKLKAYDATLLVHWLDAPGLANKSEIKHRPTIPEYQDSRFHVFLHGSSKQEKDNCDCYFDTRTGVIDANRNAADSKVTSPAVCY